MEIGNFYIHVSRYDDCCHQRLENSRTAKLATAALVYCCGGWIDWWDETVGFPEYHALMHWQWLTGQICHVPKPWAAEPRNHLNDPEIDYFNIPF
ncbi:MAG: hypothetical protein ACPGVO_04425 [Spirulinaceae cyanobacterium]